MFYNPIFDLLRKYETHVNDFLIQGAFYITAYTIDKYIFYASGRKNVIFLSLLIFIFLFTGSRTFIRYKKWEKHFGNFVNWSVHYAAFLAFFSWLCYLLFIRWRF